MPDRRMPLADSMQDAAGNASRHARETLAKWWTQLSPRQGFAQPVCDRLQCTEMAMADHAHAPGKKDARMVFEIEVVEDMCNYLGAMHGGCTAFLVDICSSMLLNFLAIETESPIKLHVSLALNVTFHAPAVKGSRLKITNTAISFGSRVLTTRTEIYDITNGRIVASGIHMKMPPSQPKL